MATFSKLLLSGSTSGKPVPVAATSSPGTTIHTAVSGATSFDEIWLWASNVTGTQATLTIQWGGTSDPADMVLKAYPIPPNSSMYPVVTGLLLNGGLLVKAFSGTASAINLSGYVNQIVP